MLVDRDVDDRRDAGLFGCVQRIVDEFLEADDRPFANIVPGLLTSSSFEQNSANREILKVSLRSGAFIVRPQSARPIFPQAWSTAFQKGDGRANAPEGSRRTTFPRPTRLRYREISAQTPANPCASP